MKKQYRLLLKINNHYFEKIKQIVFLSFVFLLPTQFGKHFFSDFSYINGVKIDYLSIIIYLTDIVFFLLFVLNFNLIKNQLKKKKWVFFILFILFFVNILISKYPLLSFYRFLKIVELYFVFLIFKNNQEKRLITISFLSGGLSQLLLSLFQLYRKSSLQGIFYLFGERQLNLSYPDVARSSFDGVQFLRPYGTFSHPNSLAGFYLLLYFYFLTDKKLDKNYVFKLFALLIFTVLIFISFSKIAILTYLLLNLAYFFLVVKNHCRLCQMIKMLTIIMSASIFLLVKNDPLSLVKRFVLFLDGISILWKNFIFGVGLNHYLFYQAKINNKYPYFFLQPVHNIFVLFFSETGIILGGVILYLLIKFFKKNADNQDKIPLIFCLVIIIATGSLDHYWLTLQQNWLLMGTIFGIITAKESDVKPKSIFSK